MYLLTTFKARWKKELEKNRPDVIEKYKQIGQKYIDKGTKNETAESIANKLLKSKTNENVYNAGQRSKGFAKNKIINKSRLNKIRDLKDNLASKEYKEYFKDFDNITSNNKSTKPKFRLNKKVALGVAGAGTLAVGALALNKLRKSRKDKGKLRGKYKP